MYQKGLDHLQGIQIASSMQQFFYFTLNFIINSLVNIYKEMAQDIDGFEIPDHGNLIGWARQGVLLLNACLTVRAHSANSHKDQGWELLTSSVIKWISDNSRGVVFLLWGSYAQKRAEVVDKV